MFLNTIYTTFQGISYYKTEYENYYVSKCGKVLSTKYGNNRLLKQSEVTKGYLSVSINRKTIKVHKLISNTFLGVNKNIQMVQLIMRMVWDSLPQKDMSKLNLVLENLTT